MGASPPLEAALRGAGTPRPLLHKAGPFGRGWVQAPDLASTRPSRTLKMGTVPKRSAHGFEFPPALL